MSELRRWEQAGARGSADDLTISTVRTVPSLSMLDALPQELFSSLLDEVIPSREPVSIME